MRSKYTCFCLVLMISSGSISASQDATTKPARFGEAAKDKDGSLVHTIESPRQKGTTRLRILLPDSIEKGRRYPVMYVLPVERLDEHRFGDGLAEVRRLGLHNTHGLICVYPTFSHTPWYADHPTDPNIRQESYLLTDVLPFVEASYPALAEPRGRLLLGFSKSGWGAWSLLLRHPDVFGKAAAWDAPLTKGRPDAWGMAEVLGTQENFLGYHVPTLLERVAARLGRQPRLALLGWGNFRDHHEAIRKRLLALNVPHEYRDGPRRKHHWAGGWVAEAVAFLAASPPEKKP